MIKSKIKAPKKVWIYRNKETQSVSVTIRPVKLSDNYYLIGKYSLVLPVVKKKIKCPKLYWYNETPDIYISQL